MIRFSSEVMDTSHAAVLLKNQLGSGIIIFLSVLHNFLFTTLSNSLTLWFTVLIPSSIDLIDLQQTYLIVQLDSYAQLAPKPPHSKSCDFIPFTTLYVCTITFKQI